MSIRKNNIVNFLTDTNVESDNVFLRVGIGNRVCHRFRLTKRDDNFDHF